MLRWILAITASAVVASLVLVSFVYLRDISRSHDRVQGRSLILPSPHGDIEYVDAGSGPAVLVIHGSGGGFDQGEILAEAVPGAGFRCVIPSRFGYLGSIFRDGATWDDQAHAYACLLDELGMDKVAVVALSHGGPSALVFAELHPERAWPSGGSRRPATRQART